MSSWESAATEFDDLTLLVSLLCALPLDARRAETRHLLRVLDGRQHANDRPAENGSAQPFTIAPWARDDGRTANRQQLSIGLAPQPVPMPKTAAATGQSVLSNGRLGADLIHLPAGECFLPHTHPGDHLLFVLAGKGTITINGKITGTSAGQAYLVEGLRVHAVGAITDHVILAVGAPHRAIDDPDRQALVEYDAVSGDTGTVTCRLCSLTAPNLHGLAASGCAHVPRECR
jgi:quercetin dioxygenase-like cupin family protein